MGAGKEEQPTADGTDGMGRSRAAAPQCCVQGCSPCPESPTIKTENLVQQAPVLPGHGEKKI